MNPSGKVAVISGGSSGLGRATAELLASLGATAVVLDLVAPASPSAGMHFFACDVASAPSLEGAVDEVIARFGAIHICINCAGIGGLGPIASEAGPGDFDAFKRVLDVNLLGTVNLTRLAAYRMIANPPDGPDGERGIIINAASIASFEGQQAMGAYTASKAAIAALTLVWARDLSAYSIRCMSIAAGFFSTPMTAGLPDTFVAELVKTNEFPRRAGTAGEFAELAAFIVRSPLLNAETIRLDGGARPPARTLWTAGA
jgi:NAD(P)-dependent dehydrogenase (short-subunit alcohol dehydrogenase family)